MASNMDSNNNMTETMGQITTIENDKENTSSSDVNRSSHANVSGKLPLIFHETPKTGAQGQSKSGKARSKAISCISAAARVGQFPDDLYAESDMLFCKFCLHSLDSRQALI